MGTSGKENSSDDSLFLLSSRTLPEVDGVTPRPYPSCTASNNRRIRHICLGYKARSSSVHAFNASPELRASEKIFHVNSNSVKSFNGRLANTIRCCAEGRENTHVKKVIIRILLNRLLDLSQSVPGDILTKSNRLNRETYLILRLDSS